eukprot:237852-Chlamydomonas_euryale.AAC.5
MHNCRMQNCRMLLQRSTMHNCRMQNCCMLLQRCTMHNCRMQNCRMLLQRSKMQNSQRLLLDRSQSAPAGTATASAYDLGLATVFPLLAAATSGRPQRFAAACLISVLQHWPCSTQLCCLQAIALFHTGKPALGLPPVTRLLGLPPPFLHHSVAREWWGVGQAAAAHIACTRKQSCMDCLRTAKLQLLRCCYRGHTPSVR